MHTRTPFRILLALSALSTFGACGVDDASKPSGSDAGVANVGDAMDASVSRDAQVVADPCADAPPFDESTEAPTFVMLAEGGTQEAASGSFCASTKGPGCNMSACGDTLRPRPHHFTIVHPADVIEISMHSATLTPSENCGEHCSSPIKIAHVGCDDDVGLIPLASDTTKYSVDLEPGTYELQLFAYFDSATLEGDASGALGLIVDASRPRGIVAAEAESDDAGTSCDAGF